MAKLPEVGLRHSSGLEELVVKSQELVMTIAGDAARREDWLHLGGECCDRGRAAARAANAPLAGGAGAVAHAAMGEVVCEVDATAAARRIVSRACRRAHGGGAAAGNAILAGGAAVAAVAAEARIAVELHA